MDTAFRMNEIVTVHYSVWTEQSQNMNHTFPSLSGVILEILKFRNAVYISEFLCKQMVYYWPQHLYTLLVYSGCIHGEQLDFKMAVKIKDLFFVVMHVINKMIG